MIGRGGLGGLAELLLALDHDFGEARHLVLGFALVDGAARERVDVHPIARFDGFLGQLAADVPQRDVASSQLDALELNSEAVEQRLGQVSDGHAQEALDLRPLVEIRIQRLGPDVENILPRRLHQHEAGTTVVRGERHGVLDHESWWSAVSSESIGALLEQIHQRSFPVAKGHLISCGWRYRNPHSRLDTIGVFSRFVNGLVSWGEIYAYGPSHVFGSCALVYCWVRNAGG